MLEVTIIIYSLITSSSQRCGHATQHENLFVIEYELVVNNIYSEVPVSNSTHKGHTKTDSWFLNYSY